MARPLRVDVADAWYHVMNRGHRGGALFLDEADRRRFLGVVAELPERFELEVHAFVLMPNHYHVLVRTREANLSQAIHWLNVSYAVKFNWAHRCRGTVFQGRFKGVLIQEEDKAVEVARYVHLNPVPDRRADCATEGVSVEQLSRIHRQVQGSGFCGSRTVACQDAGEKVR